jgi:pimeloyl-ACP methyl ester carboxylesterase
MRRAALDAARSQCKKSPGQRLGMTQISRGVFTSDDAEIAYLDAGDLTGPPIVLVHGFASTKETNWLAPGWIDTLTRAGRRVIALDNRGHGESTKLYDPARYHTALMAEDVRALMDHLGLGRADLMGYSMGARTAAFVALAHPDRVRRLILGGLGIRLVEGVGLPETIAEALEAPSITQVTDPQGYAFRAFAQQTRSDLKALAACIRGSRQTLSREEAGRIAAPALIGVGTKDPIAGSAQELAALMPNAVALDIPGRDHMLAVGDKVFKAGVLAFLEEQ